MPAKRSRRNGDSALHLPDTPEGSTYPYHGAGYYNITEPSPSTSHTDYAANSGSNAAQQR